MDDGESRSGKTLLFDLWFCVMCRGRIIFRLDEAAKIEKVLKHHNSMVTCRQHKIQISGRREASRTPIRITLTFPIRVDS